MATAVGGKFTPAEYLQRGYKGRGVTIPLGDGEKMPNVTLTMAPTSAISGHITDRDGEPVGHARVQAMELYYENGERRLYILQVVQTNDLGEYRFYWLPPGRYFVAVIPDDILRQNVAFSIPPPGEGGHREDQLSPIVIAQNRADRRSDRRNVRADVLRRCHSNHSVPLLLIYFRAPAPPE